MLRFCSEISVSYKKVGLKVAGAGNIEAAQRADERNKPFSKYISQYSTQIDDAENLDVAMPI